MSTIKTRVSQHLVESFLKKRGITSQIKKIDGGEISQAFSFVDGKDEKIFRVNSVTDEGFQKDKFASEHFIRRNLAIPEIEELGELDKNLYYAMSKRAQGTILYNLSEAEVGSIMPEIIKTTTSIHATSPAGEGYGWWRLNGNGKASSWHEALDEMQKSEDDYKLGSVTFYEPGLRSKLAADIRRYYKYCPNERRLVHSDLVGNALCDGKKITGVIDWHGSMYGDPLWDVAWFDFWQQKHNYAASFKNYYESEGVLSAHFDERLTCYKLIIGANCLAFFAKTHQHDKYDYAKQIILDFHDI